MVDEHAAQLREALADLRMARDLTPYWTDWSAPDSDIWIHSLGVTFWTLLGRSLGYAPVSEAPALGVEGQACIDERVRSDAVWFDPESGRPMLIVEFERYQGLEDQAKLAGKVRNLLLAHHRWKDAPRMLVLAYWTKGLASLPRHDELSRIFSDGFVTIARERVIGSSIGRLIFYQFVLREGDDGRWRLSQIIERG